MSGLSASFQTKKRKILTLFPEYNLDEASIGIPVKWNMTSAAAFEKIANVSETNNDAGFEALKNLNAGIAFYNTNTMRGKRGVVTPKSGYPVIGAEQYIGLPVTLESESVELAGKAIMYQSSLPVHDDTLPLSSSTRNVSN